MMQQDNMQAHDLEEGNLPQGNGIKCRVNVSKGTCWGFFRKIESVAIPQMVAERSLLEGDLDTAEAELKLAKANYQRRYVYISSLVAASVAILQLSKQWVGADERASMGIDFGAALTTILGTAATGFVHAWDATADAHLDEIAKSRLTLSAKGP